MTRSGIVGLALAVALTHGAAAQSLDALYDDAEIADLAPLYERGWTDNFENVFVPAFTEDERARLQGIRFEMVPRVPGNEPFGFAARGTTITVSAASLRFLEDVAMAYTWLDRKGHSTQSLGDYLLMLRYWNEAEVPPKPWDALCIPADAFSDDEVAEPARRAFSTAAVFVLLHEYGHAFHRHPGNRAVPPEVSRANEVAADSFAFDLIVRVGDMPVGVPILFFTMTNLMENRADFASDSDYQSSLAARTHPVSPERLQSLARHMSEWASVYDRNAKPGAQATALAIGLEVSRFAQLLADPGIQGLSSRVGRTAKPQDLAPRPRGRFLAAPCGREATDQDFDGTLSGQISDGRTPLDVDVVLNRQGSEVTGSYSFGAGFGRLEGQVDGADMSYRWTLPPDEGMGSITLGADGGYQGSWGFAGSDSGGGLIQLRR
jgi:hypothetical protein